MQDLKVMGECGGSEAELRGAMTKTGDGGVYTSLRKIEQCKEKLKFIVCNARKKAREEGGKSYVVYQF